MSTYRPDPQSALSTQKTHGRKLRIIFVPWERASPEAEEWKKKSEQWNTAKPDKKFEIVYYDPAEKHNAHLREANADEKAVIYIRGHGSPGANSLKANVGDEQRSLAMTDVCQRLMDMGLDPAFHGAIKFHSCYSATVFTEGSFKESHAAALRSLDQSRRMKDYLTTGLPQDLEEARSKLNEAQTDLKAEQDKFFFQRGWGEVGRLTELADRRGKRVRDLETQQLQTAGADAYIRERELRVPTEQSIAAQGAAYMRNHGFNNCSYFGYLGPMESLYAVDTSSPEQKEVHKFVSVEHLMDPPREVAAMLKEKGDKMEKPEEARKAVRASTVRMKILPTNAENGGQ